jgi:hypothetical protein
LSDESLVYAVALILHPSRRKAHIQKNWRRSWHRTTFNSVKKLREDDYKELPSENSLSLFESEQIPDEYELLAWELNVVGRNSDIKPSPHRFQYQLTVHHSLGGFAMSSKATIQTYPRWQLIFFQFLPCQLILNVSFLVHGT